MNKPYHVDLLELMRIYETNYAKLNALVPISSVAGDIYCYQAVDQSYQITVIEITKYTSLVEVFQIGEMPIFPLPKLSVRLYHDARVAEVIGGYGKLYVKPIYDYPNDKMRQKDEKAQLNRFLRDWLNFCLKHGIRRTPIDWREP
ncbi:DUF1249 family protein [Vibrio sp.]|nr:DUF1249 family protein [Vibrio sp.]